MRNRGREHLGAHEIDVRIGAASELGRKEVGAEECRFWRERVGDLERSSFILDVEAVPRLDLDRGCTCSMRFSKTLADELIEQLGRG